MAKKLAIIGVRGCPGNFPGSSGIDVFVEKLIPYLTESFEVTVFTRSWVKPIKSKGSRIRIIPVPCLRDKYFDTGVYTVFVTLAALMSKQEIFWYHATGSCLLSFLPRIMGKKVIFTMHALEWQRKKWSQPLNKHFLKSLEKTAVLSANYCTAVSENLVNYTTRVYHRPCLLTPPGFIPQTPTSAKLIQNKYHLTSGGYLLYLGRLVEEKRIEWLIRGYLESEFLKNSYKLIIAGSLEKNDYVVSLKKISQNNPNIIFTDYVSGQLKKELISNCKLFVSASNLEGNSIALAEALEYNKVCLVADLPTHKLIRNNNKLVNLYKCDSFIDFKSCLQSATTKDAPGVWPITALPWSSTAQQFINLFKK